MDLSFSVSVKSPGRVLRRRVFEICSHDRRPPLEFRQQLVLERKSLPGRGRERFLDALFLFSARENVSMAVCSGAIAVSTVALTALAMAPSATAIPWRVRSTRLLNRILALEGSREIGQRVDKGSSRASHPGLAGSRCSFEKLPHLSELVLDRGLGSCGRRRET